MNAIRKIAIGSCWVFTLLLALGLAAYIYIFVTTISVRNVSSAVLENVTVMFGDKKMWQGHLRPGDSKWIVGTFNTGGELIIRYEVDGAELILNAGYSSPVTAKHKVYHLTVD